MRSVVIPLLLIPLLFAIAQDKKPRACDMKMVAEGAWCPKCKKALENDQVDKGKCKSCSGEIEKHQLCAKEWVPRCGMHEMRPHETPCCPSKFCCKVEVVKCRVGMRCGGCGAWAPTEDKIEHDKKEHDKKAAKACEKSGDFPHGGELKPKFERESAGCKCAERMGAGKCKCVHCQGTMEGAKCYCGTGGCQCGAKMGGCQCNHCAGVKGGDDGKDGCGCVNK